MMGGASGRQRVGAVVTVTSPGASELLSEPDDVISECVPLELSEMGIRRDVVPQR